MAEPSVEDRVARAILSERDQDSIDELAWEDSTWKSMPSDDQVLDHVLKSVLDRDALRDNERLERWLIAFAWSRIDRAALERALRAELRKRFLPGALRFVRQELEAEGISCRAKKAKPKPSPPKNFEKSQVLAALKKLDAETPGGLHSFRKIRPMVAMSPERFDRAVLELAHARKLVIHHHDYPAGATEAERQAMVRDEKGTYYVGAALAPAERKVKQLPEQILEAFDRLDAGSGGRNYVTLYDLRGSLSGVSRSDFDDAVNQLRRERLVSLDSADGRHVKLSQAVIDAGIVEDGHRLVYVQRRNR